MSERPSIWSWPAEAAVVVYVALDGLVGFALRPVNRWLSSLAIIERLGAWIASLPAYVVLFLLLVPFAFAEPAKIFALYLMGTGHVVSGLILIVIAYLVSLLVVERLYHAGREKLHTIPWFARLMDWLTALRDRFLDWARATAAWRAARRLVEDVKAWFGSWRGRTGGASG